MLTRYLSDDLINALSPLVGGIADDHELQPEIRNNSLTIYYRGAALIRNLRLDNGKLTGEIHYKYIPLQHPNNSDYVQLVGSDEGLAFDNQPGPLAPGWLSLEAVAEYKRMIRSAGNNLESQIVHEIVRNPKNLIVDQEIMFQNPGDHSKEKIDICHYDMGLNGLAFVEVKGIHDPRLRSDNDEFPEVIEQLHRYRLRLEQQHLKIVEACSNSVSIKDRLGLKARLNGIPENHPLHLLKKPVLVIGGCSRGEVGEILAGDHGWNVLLEGLREEAAGLILCGSDGCQLGLRTGTQARLLDDSRF